MLIANGWLKEADYYAALAAACGADFKPEIAAQDVAPPTPESSPRECLAEGLLRERRRRRRVVFAPEEPTSFARHWQGFRHAACRWRRRTR